MKVNSVFLVCFIGLIISCQDDPTMVIHSSDKSDISTYNLIDPQLANKFLLENSKNYIPIHVSKELFYKEEHIPNAINIWRPDYGSDHNTPYAGLIPSREKLQSLLRTIGYDKGKTLLLYDIKANVDAMRFAWVLNLYGFDNFKIINGGLKYWKLSGLEVTDKQKPKSRPTNYQLEAHYDDSIIANFNEVLAAIKDTNTLIIDTREDYEFKGFPFVHKKAVLPYKKGAFDRGSIPSAIHLNWSTLADLNGDHRIKSEKDLRYDLRMKGINPNKNIILYCHSGSRTSHTYYVLKHVLGYNNVKNYDGSWIEWSYKNSLDNSIPIQKISTENQFNEKRDSLTASLNNYE